MKLMYDVTERGQRVYSPPVYLLYFSLQVRLLIPVPPSPPLLLLPPPPPAWVFLLCSRTPFQLFSISKMRHKSKLPCDTAATQPPLTDTERDGGEREASGKKEKTGREEGEDGGMEGETGKLEI